MMHVDFHIYLVIIIKYLELLFFAVFMVNLFHILHIFGANNPKPASSVRMRSAAGGKPRRKLIIVVDNHFHVRGPT
jgi:hypothetical protein